MNTTTLNRHMTVTNQHAVGSEMVPASRFRRLWRHMIKAQEARAIRLLYQHFASFPDEHLRGLGYSKAEIAEIRTYPRISLAYRV